MVTELIDLNSNVEDKNIKLQPSYFDLEQTIIEQKNKIKMLEETINYIQKDVIMLKHIHNNFLLEIDYIDYNECWISIKGAISTERSSLKKMKIDITSDKLDFKNILLSKCSFVRLKRLINLQHIILRRHMFVICKETENGVVINIITPYDEGSLKNLVTVHHGFKSVFSPRIEII
jgi:hypothetical protein